MPTLSELKQKKETGIVDNPSDLKVLSKDDIRKVLPKKEEDNTAQQLLEEQLGDIDKIINSEKEATEKAQEDFINNNEDVLDDAIFDAPIEDIDSGIIHGEDADKVLQEAFKNAIEDENIQTVTEAVSNAQNTEYNESDLDDLLSELDDDMFDEEDEVDIDETEEKDEEEREEQRKLLKDVQTQVSNAIKPFNDIIDLKSFTVSKKPKRAARVLEATPQKPTASWVLLDSGVPFVCSALGAVEIEKLDPKKTNAQHGRIEALKQLYGTLFSHYESADKPKSLEEWLKTISYADQDNLLFGYYKATFGLSNLITYACEKCKTVKVENVPIENCIKYRDDETKEMVNKILNGDTSYKGKIYAKRIQVSDTMVVDIKNPSIYNIVFEFGILDNEFNRKFADVLGVAGYIDAIYEIDRVNGQLIPIEIKEDAKNLVKSVKRRIRAKVELLRNLTSDQYNILTTEIANIANNANRITYCQPEYTCKKCGFKIQEVEMSAQELLFIRHQLALIKNLSIE